MNQIEVTNSASSTRQAANIPDEFDKIAGQSLCQKVYGSSEGGRLVGEKVILQLFLDVLGLGKIISECRQSVLVPLLPIMILINFTIYVQCTSYILQHFFFLGSVLCLSIIVITSSFLVRMSCFHKIMCRVHCSSLIQNLPIREDAYSVVKQGK